MEESKGNEMDKTQYMENAQGHLIPLSHVKEIDIARDELVKELVAQVQAEREALTKLKERIMGDIKAFVQMSAEQHDVVLGGKKGNISLTTYDGKYKIKRQISEHLAFDEQLQAAKELIDECLKDWTVSSPTELQAIVNDAFQVDKEDKLNTGRILGLQRLSIADERWKRAMKAISDSIQVTGSKAYFRVYERDENGKYQHLALDIAAL